jgi:hypothetical protein
MAGQNMELPRRGDRLHSKPCGMQFKVEQDCRCDEGKPRLECCGQPLAIV